MCARYYSPYLKRFLNADPIRFEGGQNWYAYASGNPISASDPLGLFTIFGWDAGGYFRGEQGWIPGMHTRAIASDVADYATSTEYLGDVGDVFIGDAKGAANNLSFGIYEPTYANEMQAAGGGIGDGLATGGQLLTGVGALRTGLRQATRQSGREFSHWVPDRFFRATRPSKNPD